MQWRKQRIIRHLVASCCSGTKMSVGSLEQSLDPVDSGLIRIETPVKNEFLLCNCWISIWFLTFEVYANVGLCGVHTIILTRMIYSIVAKRIAQMECRVFHFSFVRCIIWDYNIYRSIVEDIPVRWKLIDRKVRQMRELFSWNLLQLMSY